MKKNETTLKAEQDEIVNTILAGRTVDSAALRDAAKQNDQENHDRKVRNAKRILSEVDSQLDGATSEVKGLRKQLADAEKKLGNLAKVRSRLAKGDISKLEEDVKILAPDGSHDTDYHRQRIITALS